LGDTTDLLGRGARVARATWIGLAVVAALAVGIVGCGSGEKRVDVRKIAFVAPYRDNEPGWTEQAREVVEEFPKSLGVRVDLVDASQTSDVRGALEQVSHEGDQLVIAHDSRYADVAEQVARQTRVPELVWGERPHAEKGLVGQLTVQDKEGGYMAGQAAALSAITRKLGILIVDDGSAWDLATWNRTAGGFVAGARAAEPHEQIVYATVGQNGHATIKQVYDATLREIDHGAQMIFTLGGAATLGALRAVEKRQGEEQYIGVVGDKAEFNRENFMLASVMWETRAAFREAVRELRAGRFGEHPYELTVKNRGIWLMTTGRSPIEAKTAAERAARKIAAGRLRIPVTSTAEAVKALIAGSVPQG
jgi:basic membrane protein A and related proteins